MLSQLETKVLKGFVAIAAVIYCSDWLLGRYIMAVGVPTWLKTAAPDFARGAKQMYTILYRTGAG